jgi:hypothetical protein
MPAPDLIRALPRAALPTGDCARPPSILAARTSKQGEDVLAGGAVTRDWEALAMTDLIGEGGQITVTGEVELTASGPTAELREHLPPETNPRILLLDLVIHRHGGPEGHAGWFERLTFKKKSLNQAYEEVAILYGGAVVQRVKVEHPLTFAAPPPRAAKKPSAKEPAAKTAAPKMASVKPGAKKRAKSGAAKKKTAQKAAVKPARKATKKSGKKKSTRKRT